MRLIKKYTHFLSAAVLNGGAQVVDGGHLTSEDTGFNYSNLKLYIKSIEHLEYVGTDSSVFVNLKNGYYCRDVGVLYKKNQTDRKTVMRELTTAYLETMYFNIQVSLEALWSLRNSIISTKSFFR